MLDDWRLNGLKYRVEVEAKPFLLLVTEASGALLNEKRMSSSDCPEHLFKAAAENAAKHHQGV